MRGLPRTRVSLPATYPRKRGPRAWHTGVRSTNSLCCERGLHLKNSFASRALWPALASRGTRTLSRGLSEQSPVESSKERRARCGRLRRTAKDTLNRARGRRKARLSARLSDQSSIAVYLRRAGGAAAARHCAQTRRRRREPDLSRRVSPARQSGKDRWRLAIGACCARLTAVARQKVVHLCLTLRVWLARGSH